MIGALVANWKHKHRRNTTANYRGKLQQFLRVLEGFGAQRIQAPKVPPETARPVTATGGELAKLMEAPPAWLRLYMLLYFQCGLRRAETLRVTRRSWNPDAHTATIQVKGGTTRTAELTPEVEALMGAVGEPDDPDTSYIDLLHGKHITAEGLKKAWHRHRDRCGVNPQLIAHDLRRTAATILFNATKDLRVPQQLLGHKNLASTLRYLAPMAPDEARKYSELLHFHNYTTKEDQKPS
jgi:integrase